MKKIIWVLMAILVTAVVNAVSITNGYQGYLDPNSNTLVYSDTNEVYKVNIDSGKPMQITKQLSPQFAPFIFNKQVYWVDKRKEGRNMVYAGIYSENGELPINHSNLCSSYVKGIRNGNDPVIYNEYIAWANYDNGDFIIYLYNINTNETISVDRYSGSSVPTLSMDNDKLVYSMQYKGIKVYDIESKELTLVPINSGINGVGVSGDYILYADNIEERENSDVRMYNLKTNVTTSLTFTDDKVEAFPFVYGNYVAFEQIDKEGNSEIIIMDYLTGDYVNVVSGSYPQFNDKYILYYTNCYLGTCDYLNAERLNLNIKPVKEEKKIDIPEKEVNKTEINKPEEVKQKDINVTISCIPPDKVDMPWIAQMLRWIASLID